MCSYEYCGTDTESGKIKMFVLKHCTKPCFCPALSQKGPTNLAVSLSFLPLFIPSAPEHPSLEVLFFDARITLSSAHEIQTAFILHTTIIIVNIEPAGYCL